VIVELHEGGARLCAFLNDERETEVTLYLGGRAAICWSDDTGARVRVNCEAGRILGRFVALACAVGGPDHREVQRAIDAAGEVAARPFATDREIKITVADGDEPIELGELRCAIEDEGGGELAHFDVAHAPAIRALAIGQSYTAEDGPEGAPWTVTRVR
jgi:hypothetical protein